MVDDRFLMDVVRGATARAAAARRDVRLAFAQSGAAAAERVARSVAAAPAVFVYQRSRATVYYVDGWRVFSRTVRHNGATEFETY